MAVDGEIIVIEKVPELRVNPINERPIQSDGQYVIYWMVSHRRVRWNYSLQHAISIAQAHQKPLIILEALRVGYRWASLRTHQFIIEGMQNNAERCQESSVIYYPYIEPHPGAGKGLLEALSQRSICVVTDEFPCFFIPRMQAAIAPRLPVALITVDSNGILPLRAGGRVFTTAASFRRHLQKTILPYMRQWPVSDPLQEELADGAVPKPILEQWPMAQLDDINTLLEGLPIDNEVKPVPFRGGSSAAEDQLSSFFKARHLRYHSDRNQVDNGSASGLSPYLHFGHLSAHEFVYRSLELCGWTEQNVAVKPNGSRTGWWGVPAHTESLLDELITWREIGYVFCFERLNDYDQFSSLPEWAQKTLQDHAQDPRPYTYTLEQLENADTHDPIWNAAQRQLRQEGRIHNYLRMLWGKKVLEWSESPQQALEHLIELNNRWAIDGRNPNSYSGIFWTLGRFDRAWGPERPIFGKIRFMSSDSTKRKLKLSTYLNKFGAV